MMMLVLGSWRVISNHEEYSEVKKSLYVEGLKES